MDIHVSNSSALKMEQMGPLLKSFLPFAQERMGFSEPVSVNFASDAENAEKPLGKTAFYDPNANSITVFVDKRHPKDIMRSLSHELVHHTQNCAGKFDGGLEVGEGYAQNDEHLRDMEREAYEKGNLTFRDWEDQNKKSLQESVFWSKNTLITEEKGPILLSEGGAAGHMAHPFDLDYVKTGQDLLNFFTDKVPAYLETNVPSIKTDGTNVSFKLISKTDFYGEEKREFAADRGSQKAIDIEGITGDNIEQRFKPGHGLIPGILDVLEILNAALNAGVIDEEIKTMGLVDNPSYFINTEHVKETEERPQVNAIKYDENFIAFHGVNEFFMKPSPKGKSMSRKSKEVATTKNSSAALQSFTNKVRRFARDYNVYGPEDTKATKREGVSINFDSALGEKLPIFLSEGTESTDTLGGWLRNPRTINPFGATIVLADGRKMGAMSKHVYTNLAIDKVPVSDLLGGMEGDKRQMAIDAINGAIFYHATRNLGIAVLKTLDAGFGGATLDKHEGIVMRDKDVFGVTFPIKITGDFIVDRNGWGYQPEDGKRKSSTS